MFFVKLFSKITNIQHFLIHILWIFFKCREGPQKLIAVEGAEISPLSAEMTGVGVDTTDKHFFYNPQYC